MKQTRRYGRKWPDQALAAGHDIGETVRTTKTIITLRQTEAQRATMREAAYQTWDHLLSEDRDRQDDQDDSYALTKAAMRVISNLDEPQPGERAYGWMISNDPRAAYTHEPGPYDQTREGAYQALKWQMTWTAQTAWKDYYQPPGFTVPRFRRRRAEKQFHARRRQADAKARRQVAALINTNTPDRISIELPPDWATGQPQPPLQGQIHPAPEPPQEEQCPPTAPTLKPSTPPTAARPTFKTPTTAAPWSHQ